MKVSKGEHVKRNLRRIGELEKEIEEMRKKSQAIRSKDDLNWLMLKDGEEVDVFFIEDENRNTFSYYPVHYRLPGGKSAVCKKFYGEDCLVCDYIEKNSENIQLLPKLKQMLPSMKLMFNAFVIGKNRIYLTSFFDNTASPIKKTYEKALGFISTKFTSGAVKVRTFNLAKEGKKWKISLNPNTTKLSAKLLKKARKTSYNLLEVIQKITRSDESLLRILYDKDTSFNPEEIEGIKNGDVEDLEKEIQKKEEELKSKKKKIAKIIEDDEEEEEKYIDSEDEEEENEEVEDIDEEESKENDEDDLEEEELEEEDENDEEEKEGLKKKNSSDTDDEYESDELVDEDSICFGNKYNRMRKCKDGTCGRDIKEACKSKYIVAHKKEAIKRGILK